MSVFRSSVALALSCLAGACGSTSRVELPAQLDYCFGLGNLHPCLRDAEGTYYDAIEGFEFEWGFQTVATIETRHLAEPPPDGSSIEYHLVEIESHTPVPPGTRWALALPASRGSDGLAALVGGDCTVGYELFPGHLLAKAISFESDAACESFAQSLETLAWLTFEFDTPEAPLALVEFE